jgi:integrase
MMHPSGKGRGNSMIDLRLPGIGRFRMSSGTRKKTVFDRRVALVRTLAEIDAGPELLAGLKAGTTTWVVLERAQRRQKLRDPGLAASLELGRNLKEAIEATLPRMGKSVATRERYRVALVSQLTAVGVLTETAAVRDLKRDDWGDLLDAWHVSNATKNGLRRAVSRFLSRYLGGKYHPFRHEVLHEDRWSILKVAPRIRGIEPSAFPRFIAHVPAKEREPVMLLAATGMRVGEYLNDRDIRLDEHGPGIIVAGKTGPKMYALDASLVPMAKRVIPCRVARMQGRAARIQNDARYKRLYRAVRQAGDAMGANVTIHDLRRLFVKIGVKAHGEVMTQYAVGHESPEMTREYARWHAAQEVATTVAKTLGMSGKMSGNVVTRIGTGTYGRGGRR